MKNVIRFPIERTPANRLDVSIKRLNRLHLQAKRSLSDRRQVYRRDQVQAS